MGDKIRGLYHKFDITRTDGSSAPGGKHHGCNYFVLDLTHDKFASAALEAYARACEEEFPFLAADLFCMLAALPGTLAPGCDQHGTWSKQQAETERLSEVFGTSQERAAGEDNG